MCLYEAMNDKPDCTTINRRRVTVGECRRKLAFSGFHLLILALAVIFAPHAYMKIGFAASGLIRLSALRREYDLLRRVESGEIVEVIARAQNSSTTASVVAVAFVTTFALCCTALSIAALAMAGNSHGAAIFFLAANLIVWGFAACIWRAAYRAAHLPVASQSRAPAVLALDAVEKPVVKDAVASVPASASSRHWWTDTQLREETKVVARR